MSELTSLKVPVQVRDRFAAAARSRGITVRALLVNLSHQAEDAALMSEVDRQMWQASPQAWDDYLHEGHQWEEGTTEPMVND